MSVLPNKIDKFPFQDPREREREEKNNEKRRRRRTARRMVENEKSSLYVWVGVCVCIYFSVLEKTIITMTNQERTIIQECIV